MQMKRIYIAGPMSGLPGLNFDAFHAEAKRLRALGFDVVNPAEINADTTAQWADCMRADIRELMTCDAIQLLPGWENSRGATLERHIGQSLGMEILPPSVHDVLAQILGMDDEPILEATGEDGHEIKVWADGRVQGLPRPYLIMNRIAQLRDMAIGLAINKGMRDKRPPVTDVQKEFG